MTSATEATASRPEEEDGEEEEGTPPPPPAPHFPPPAAASGKPLTPFSIADILGKPCGGERGAGRGRRGGPSASASAAFAAFSSTAAPSASASPSASARSPGPASPLCALEQLASKTFRGLEGSPLLHAAANGRDPLSTLLPRPAAKKRRKSRTAFTNHQIFELEKRFVFQKYLSPADRDHLSAQLGLSNAQVITWFQNRRAKLKRDLEEMKADVESLKKLPPDALQRLARLPEEPPAQGPPSGGAKGPGRGKDAHPEPEPRPRDALSDGEDEEDEEEEEDDEDDEEEEIDVGD